MGSTSSERINLSASAQKLDVDHRISLGVYLRMADDFLKQADKHRQEKNVVDLYISLLRFSSLVSETIPYHRDYRGSDEPEKVSLKKKLLNALNELEELKPAVEEMLNEKRNARQNPAWSCNLQPVGAPTSSIRIDIVNSDSFPEKRTILRPLSRPKQECEYGSPFGLPCNQKEIKKGESSSTSCIICLDAPVEGAFIPCGHMAGCMSCLNEVKAKKWGCPVCRAKIDQVIKLYAV
ncbi:hypothetical protein M0R45_018442 [Rubus argutus]|uniref:RING-type domain-containing protein n=1 Tax=Rubus argutus TaxID=59490 RepID=A0AAW1X3V1_RUBAR